MEAPFGAADVIAIGERIKIIRRINVLIFIAAHLLCIFPLVNLDCVLFLELDLVRRLFC